MKSNILSPLTLIVTLFSILSFVSPTHSRTLLNKNDLISQTCSQTPNPTLCDSTLLSNPRSSTSNLIGLSLMMVQAVKSKANETLVHIDSLLKRSHSPILSNDNKQKTMLSSCGDNYKAILEDDVPETVEALTKGDYKFGEQGMNDVLMESDICEGLFSEKEYSPLKELNKDMHDVAGVALAMVRMLMSG